LEVEKLKESTKSNYKAVIRTLYSKYKKVAIEEDNSIMRMLEGERYKANEIYRDFKFIIGEWGSPPPTRVIDRVGEAAGGELSQCGFIKRLLRGY
jgi:hypothetical protein